MLGFYRFTEPTPVVEPTMRQRVVALDDGTRNDILNGFANARPAAHTATELKLDYPLVNYVYTKIDEIQEASKQLMRGEYITTPAVLDAEGNVITPAVYADVPTTQILLRQAIAPLFVDDFPVNYCSNIVNAMIAWSKYDGTGTFAFYQSQIIL
jgi:hypothetical protein